MELAPELVLTIDRTRDLRELPLTPEDFFLFSRVEGLSGSIGPTVADVVAASGQSPAKAQSILQRLIELGAVTASKPAPTPANARLRKPDAVAESLRQRAQDRRRGLLEAQLSESATRLRVIKLDQETESAASQSSDSLPSLPTAKAEVVKGDASVEVALRPILSTITPVAETDPRLLPAITIPIDLQRRLLGVRDNLRRIGHFELLGLDPTDDPRALRRAYHVASREFHPDSFYGKDIGHFRHVLDDLFRRARASFEFLGESSRRRALVEVHEASLAEQRADVEADQRRLAEQTQREQAAKDALAAEQTAQAQAARELRDVERKHRLRERVANQRRQQAKSHADEGEAELAAGKHASAATFFRLAYSLDSDNSEYEHKWRECLAIARRQRAEFCFEHGREALKQGRPVDAARLLSEAADADPSLRNLVEAASVVAEVNPARARDFALAALEALHAAAVDDKTSARTYFACARAFLAAGQLHSAREYAERSHALVASEQTRALLNSIKLA